MGDFVTKVKNEIKTLIQTGAPIDPSLTQELEEAQKQQNTIKVLRIYEQVLDIKQQQATA